MQISSFRSMFPDEAERFGEYVEAVASDLEDDALSIERSIANADPYALRQAAHRARAGLINAEYQDAAALAALLDIAPVAGAPFPKDAARALLDALRPVPEAIRRTWLPRG